MLYAIWNRALTAEEIQQLSTNPWQMFEPTGLTRFQKLIRKFKRVWTRIKGLL